MDRRPEHESVVVLGRVQEYIHCVLIPAPPRLGTEPAADTAGEGMVPDPESIAPNSRLPQSRAHRLESRVGTAALVRTPVYQKYLHVVAPFCLFVSFSS